MKRSRIQQVIRQALCLACMPLIAGGLLVAQQPGPPPQGPPEASAQLLSPQQLDTMVAPIALYPDALLSQVLVASTYPLEITEASQWLEQNGSLQGAQRVDAARQQNWDASIQALVVFPDVVSRLASDIRWTTDLGNAFLAQQADVMTAVQRMRAQARASGKLRSNEQQTVTTEMDGDQSAIDIQPANPETVYVPSYNPQYIWGAPSYGYYPSWDYLDVGFGYGYGFGPGIYIGGFYGGLGWGGWGWGPNWFRRSIYERGGFFGRYGYSGFHGGGLWAHDAGHRLGVAYSNRSLNQRYGAVSAASVRSSTAGSRYNSASRATAGQAGGWNRFGQAGASANARGGQGNYRPAPANGGARGFQSNSSQGNYRPAPATGGNRGYQSNSSQGNYRPAPANGGNRGFQSSPSNGGSYGGNRATPSYRPTPSNGGSYGGNRATPAPSYRSAPSNGGNYGGNRAAPTYRSSPSAGRSYGGGSSARSSGGGGGGSSPRSSSGGGGGGSSRGGGGGGGGSHGGGHR